MDKENTQSYNQRLQPLLNKNNYPHDYFLMIGSGRKDGENSFIYIDNQCFKGYGFYELNHQIKNKEKKLKYVKIALIYIQRKTMLIILQKKNLWKESLQDNFFLQITFQVEKV